MARKVCWRTVVVCLVLGLGTIALYSPAFTFGFVNLDDEIYVTANPHVNRGLTSTGLLWAFQSGYAANWHPLTWLSHMVDSQIFGPRAGGHHATSLLLHALNSVLLFLVLRRMTGAFWRSAAVAAFFAWHPLHVESVAWIAERKDVLSGFFWMLALWAYLRYAENSKSQLPTSKIFYALALLFFALGLMAKPMLVTLPCILLLIDWWPLGRLRFGAAPGAEAKAPPSPRISFLLIEKIPFVLFSIASCVVTVIAEHREEASSAIARLPFKVRFITAGVSYFRYLEETVWPSDLGPTYPFMLHRPKWELAGIALALLGISALAVASRNSRPYLLMGWLWFVGMLFPTLNLIYTGAQPMADRYMYLPSIGLFILVCWDASDVAAQWPSGRAVLGGLCGLALAGCCVATLLQLRYWKSERTLVSRIADPESNFMGHADYASYLMRHNQLPEAQAECDKAISILPDYAPLHGELGDVLLAEGKFDDAIQQYRLVQKLDPGMVAIHVSWGRALLGEKHVNDAVSEFKIVIAAQPKNFEAHKYLGEAFAVTGRTGPAVEEFRRSLALQPNQPELLNNLAWILATDPRPEIRNGPDAVKLASRACLLTRGIQPYFVGTLAAAYAEVGHFDDAISAAQKAHDIAAGEAAAAEKASQTSEARTLQSLAARDLQLLEIYRSHQPFHEKR
ncbi:MAG TPA: tetratricopeptide repeat protein [Candidatus Baltobacteraceae bacterium]|jgi:Flp pilus assembly protein TadD|nr:tetratricopeptide repeat protein [Candidatus Baltobacteraceae bacterium]